MENYRRGRHLDDIAETRCVDGDFDEVEDVRKAMVVVDDHWIPFTIPQPREGYYFDRMVLEWNGRPDWGYGDSGTELNDIPIESFEGQV